MGRCVFEKKEGTVRTGNWIRIDKIIYLDVTSNGTTGKEWIELFKAEGYRFGPNVKRILLSSSFVPSNGVTRRIALLSGLIWDDDHRMFDVIQNFAKKEGFITPHIETACLIRNMFLDEEIMEMGFCWIIPMHEPTVSSDGKIHHLKMSCATVDRKVLHAPICDKKGREYYAKNGAFAYEVPQKS